MLRKSITALFAFVLFLGSTCFGSGILERIGNWRVTVGPAGNEVYEPPVERPDIPEGTKPSEAVLRIPDLIIPGYGIDKCEIDDDVFEIKSEKNDKNYKFKITQDATLLELEYEDEKTGLELQADEMVYMGGKKAIETSDLPKNTIDTLAKIYPGEKIEKAWIADTIAGKYYVIQIAEMGFYARSDGQIQACRRVDDKGLREIDPEDEKNKQEKPLNEEQFKLQLEELLSQYRDRFNFDNQIKKIGSSPKNADGSYRYVVMGDTRSQWDLWSSIVKHIDSLNPKPAFVINSGDIVPEGYAYELRNYYIKPLMNTGIPHFVAIGNHETGDDDMAREFQYLFGKNSLNYYFDYGKARYIFFDNASNASNSEQTLKWLDKTLEQTPAGYKKFVSTHKPPATIEKWAYHAMDEKESKIFTDLMSKHDVSEVYLGHIHAYSTAKLEGVQYTLSGGGGAPLHNRFGPLGNVHHYVICDVQPDGTVKQQQVVRFYKVDEK